MKITKKYNKTTEREDIAKFIKDICPKKIKKFTFYDEYNIKDSYNSSFNVDMKIIYEKLLNSSNETYEIYFDNNYIQIILSYSLIQIKNFNLKLLIIPSTLNVRFINCRINYLFIGSRKINDHVLLLNEEFVKKCDDGIKIERDIVGFDMEYLPKIKIICSKN